MTNQNMRVQDKRGGFFMVDDIFIDLYAKDLGPCGISVYMVLCRRADKAARCYPSKDNIAEMCGMSQRQVSREVKKLVNLGIIQTTEPKKLSDGTWGFLIYTLLDKKLWKEPLKLAKKKRSDYLGEKDPKDCMAAGQQKDIQSQKQEETQGLGVLIRKTKNTDKEDTGIFSKEESILDRALTTMLPVGHRLDRFIGRRPTSAAGRAEKTSEGRAVDEIVRRQGGENQALAFLKQVVSNQGKEFFPRATSPRAIVAKYDDLLLAIQDHQGSKIVVPKTRVFDPNTNKMI